MASKGDNQALLVVVTAQSVNATLPYVQVGSSTYVFSEWDCCAVFSSIISLIEDPALLAPFSLIGTVISNLLLMVGTGIFFGGLGPFEQYFNQDAVGDFLNELIFNILTLIVDTFQAWADGARSSKLHRITT